MSGGSYNYIYQKIEDIEIRNHHSDLKRGAFQQLLKLVADAMHAIEWVDSGDCVAGAEYEAIDKCLSFTVEEEIVETEISVGCVGMWHDDRSEWKAEIISHHDPRVENKGLFCADVWVYFPELQAAVSYDMDVVKRCFKTIK